ncbi:MAG: hypothetical protein HY048_20355 [Acidobacteria bacterium]|nr:hypothetical protein [Acidobacteriota bacterium]
MRRRSTQNSRNPRSGQPHLFSLRVLRFLRLPFVAVFIVLEVPASAHDLERTRVSLTFARDGAFVLDVANDPDWLTLRLERFAPAGPKRLRQGFGAQEGPTLQDLIAPAGPKGPALQDLGPVFIDRVVLWVDGREIRPASVEYIAPPPALPGDLPNLGVYRMRGRMPIDARTLRWYYGLVIDPYPLTIRRADGRIVVEEIAGDAWSGTIDLSGQFRASPFNGTLASILLVVVLLIIPLALRLRSALA